MPCIAQRNRPLLLQGTLTTFRRRCGKPTCRCAAGEPHESPALRFTEDGRTKTLTLTAAEVAQVTAALTLAGFTSRWVMPAACAARNAEATATPTVAACPSVNRPTSRMTSGQGPAA